MIPVVGHLPEVSEWTRIQVKYLVGATTVAQWRGARRIRSFGCGRSERSHDQRRNKPRNTKGVVGLVKVFRMIRHRWWVVLAMAALGAVIAFVITNALVQRTRPEFEASAVIVFDTGTSGNSNQNSRSATPASTSSTDSETLDSALARALEANQAAIADGVGQVTSDERSAELRFNARGRDETTAVASAENMRFSYLRATTEEAAASREARLVEIVAEAGDILSRIQAAQPVAVVAAEVPDDVQAKVDLLVSLETALSQQYTNLEVDLVLAEAGDDRAGTPEEVQEELDLVTERLDEVTGELRALAAEYGLETSRNGQLESAVASESRGESSSDPRTGESASDTDATPENLADVWALDALEARYAALSLEYEQLFLDPGEPELPVLTDPLVRDLTPNIGTPPLNSVIGLLAGILIGIGLIVAEATLRSRIRDESDLHPIPVFAELPTLGEIRHASGSRELNLASRRKLGVKQLRNCVVPFTDGTDMRVIGVTGASVSADEVRGVAMELADRLGVSDRRVIVLGLDFDDEWLEDVVESDSVAALWAGIRNDPVSGVDDLKRLLVDPSKADPSGVLYLPPGHLREDPTDVALTAAFAAFMRACRDGADVVLAVMSDASSPATHALLHSLDGTLAVCAVHRSSRKEVQRFLSDAAPSGARMLGAVLLSGRSGGVPQREETEALELAAPVAETAGTGGAAAIAPRAAEEPPSVGKPKALGGLRQQIKKADGADTDRDPRPTSKTAHVEDRAGAPKGRRVSEALERVERALEPHIAPPGGPLVPIADAGSSKTPYVENRDGAPKGRRVREVLERVERALEPYIAPPGGATLPTADTGSKTSERRGYVSGSEVSLIENQLPSETEL